jgi:DNA-binding SARP family transcriptional activator
MKVVMAELDYAALSTRAGEYTWPIVVCLFGQFRVLKAGRPIAIHGAKAEALLCRLGLQHDRHIPRETILEALWPDHDPTLAGQSLNSLIYSLRKSLGDEIHGDAPILHQDGGYWLNKEAGVGVDLACFEQLIQVGDDCVLGNNLLAATPFYVQAVQLYRGDLCTGMDVDAAVERERLRAHFLSLLARLADHNFSTHDYPLCLHYAERLLRHDACREDAHRLVMRCYVRQGERAQALRQYRLCVNILRAEFDAVPESRTTLLYDQVRLDPDAV